MRRAGAWRRALHERIVGTDPDLSRFRLALRAVVTLALSLGVLWALGRRVPLSPLGPIVGSVLGMLGGVFVTEPTRRAQVTTFALLPLSAGAALALGAFSARAPLGGMLAFIPVMFVTVWAHRFGPRGVALGMVAFNAFFFALFFHAQPGQLPGLLSSVAVGVAVSALVRFVLIPDAPHRMLRRTLRAFPVMIAWLLGHLASALRSGAPRGVKRVRAVLARVNETALSLEAHLDRSVEGQLEEGKETLRARVFDLELAAGRVVAGAGDLLRAPQLTEPVRADVARALDAARALLHGDREAVQTLRQAMGQAVRDAELILELRAPVARLGVALEELFGATDLERIAPELPSKPTARAPVPTARTEDAGVHPVTRQAIQATIAGTGAMIVGGWISPDGWYLASLAAYLVVIRMPTRGAIFVRAWERALGTVGGVLLGMVLAAVVAGRPGLEIALLFAFVFVGFYALRVAYPVMVLCFTAVVAILYSLRGQYSPEVLYLRLVETVAGAAIGAIAAAFILPSRTGTRIRTLLSRVMAGAAETLEAMAANDHGPQLALERARRVDQALGELRSAAEPLTQSTLPVGREMVALVSAAATLVFYVRHLSAPGLLERAFAAGEKPLGAAFHHLSAQVRELGDALAQRREPNLVPVGLLLDEVRDFAAVKVGADLPRELELTLHWLRRIDTTLEEMVDALRG